MRKADQPRKCSMKKACHQMILSCWKEPLKSWIFQISKPLRLSLLLEQEYSPRENRKQLRLIHQARFRVSATVQEIDYQHKRNLKREVVAPLAKSDWIDRKQNLLITGACGYGKNLHCLCDWTRRLPARILCSLLSDFTAAARAHTDQS